MILAPLGILAALLLYFEKRGTNCSIRKKWNLHDSIWVVR